jgi:hypothetical protein
MHLSWELSFGVGAAALLAAIVYGAWRNLTRNRANDPITEEATREEFEDPGSYPQRREALKKRLHPS